jgi:hypothetical protein
MKPSGKWKKGCTRSHTISLAHRLPPGVSTRGRSQNCFNSFSSRTDKALKRPAFASFVNFC